VIFREYFLWAVFWKFSEESQTFMY
jgi:hypothetical protein